MVGLTSHNIWLYLILPVIFHPTHFVPVSIIHKRDSSHYFYGSSSHTRQAMGGSWGGVWDRACLMSQWNGMWAAKMMLRHCQQMLGIKQDVRLPKHCLGSIMFDLWIFFIEGDSGKWKSYLCTSRDHPVIASFDHFSRIWNMHKLVFQMSWRLQWQKQRNR